MHYDENDINMSDIIVTCNPSPEESANDKQVGGDHYKHEGLQHWDVVDRSGMGYFEAVATKYLIRWQSKNGVEDLQKARHYVEKCKEEFLSRDRVNTAKDPDDKDFRWSTFCVENKIPYPENQICMLLVNWKCEKDLSTAIELIDHPI